MKAYTIDTSHSGIGDLIVSEYDSTYTTERRTLLAGAGGVREIGRFALVAAVALGAQAVASAAKAGNTGNGAMNAVTADAGAPAGAYKVLFIEPAANGGVFAVYRPDGALDGEGAVGQAYNGTVNFTVADGAVDFVAGDEFTVTVTYAEAAKDDEGAFKYVQWDPAATNGAQVIKGVALYPAEAPDGVDGELVVLERGPVVGRKEPIVFHAGATAEQKAAAYAALAALGIVLKASG